MESLTFLQPGDKVEIVAAPSFWHGALAIVQFIDHSQPIRKIAVFLADDPGGYNVGLLRFGIEEVLQSVTNRPALAMAKES